MLDWITTYPRFRSKVAVVDGAHFLGEAAANALLKVLEEPPSFARIILIAPSREAGAAHPGKPEPRIGFAPVPEALLQQLTSDPEVLAYAQGAPGRVRWALEHPAEFNRLVSRTQGLLEAVQAGPAQTLEALKLLGEVEGALPYLGQRLRAHFAVESPAYKAALGPLLVHRRRTLLT